MHLRCFFFCKNSRNLRTFSVKFLVQRSGRVNFLTNLMSAQSADCSCFQAGGDSNFISPEGRAGQTPWWQSGSFLRSKPVRRSSCIQGVFYIVVKSWDSIHPREEGEMERIPKKSMPNVLKTAKKWKILLTALRARGDLLPKKISRGEVGEAVLGHDLVALGALATKKE